MVDTRIHDRELLIKQRDQARTTREREKVDQVLHQVRNESRQTNATREKLIQAIRHNDHRARAYFEEQLRGK